MQPGSSIINIGSVWGILAGMGGGSYCAVKAALIGLTQSIAADYGAQGIRAILVAPGVVRTDMTEGFWETEGFKRSEEHTSELQSLMRISYDAFCLKNKTYIISHRSTYNQSPTL